MLAPYVIAIIVIAGAAVLGVSIWLLWKYVFDDESEHVKEGYRIEPMEGTRNNPRALSFTRVVVSDRAAHHNHCTKSTADSNEKCKLRYVTPGMSTIVSFEGEYVGMVQFAYSSHGHDGPFIPIGAPVDTRSTNWTVPTNVLSSNCVIRVMPPSQPNMAIQSEPFAIIGTVTLGGLGSRENDEATVGEQCAIILQTASLKAIRGVTLEWGQSQSGWTEVGSVTYEEETGYVTFAGLSAWANAPVYFRVTLDNGTQYVTQYPVTFTTSSAGSESNTLNGTFTMAVMETRSGSTKLFHPGDAMRVRFTASGVTTVNAVYTLGLSGNETPIFSGMPAASSEVQFNMPFPRESTTITITIIDSDNENNSAVIGPLPLQYGFSIVTSEAFSDITHPEAKYYRQDFPGDEDLATWSYEVPMSINGYEASLWESTSRWSWWYIPVDANNENPGTPVKFDISSITFQTNGNVYYATVSTNSWAFDSAESQYVQFRASNTLATDSTTGEFAIEIFNSNNPTGHNTTPPTDGDKSGSPIQSVTVSPGNGATSIQYGSPAVIYYRGNYHGMVQIAGSYDNGDTWIDIRSEANVEGTKASDQWRISWTVNLSPGNGRLIKVTDDTTNSATSDPFDVVAPTAEMQFYSDLGGNDLVLRNGTKCTMIVKTSSSIPPSTTQLLSGGTDLVGAYNVTKSGEAITIDWTPNAVGTYSLTAQLNWGTKPTTTTITTDALPATVISMSAITLAGVAINFEGRGVAVTAGGRILIPEDSKDTRIRWNDTSLTLVRLRTFSSDGYEVAAPQMLKSGSSFMLETKGETTVVMRLEDVDVSNVTNVPTTAYQRVEAAGITAYSKLIDGTSDLWRTMIHFSIPKSRVSSTVRNNVAHWSIALVYGGDSYSVRAQAKSQDTTNDMVVSFDDVIWSNTPTLPSTATIVVSSGSSAITSFPIAFSSEVSKVSGWTGSSTCLSGCVNYPDVGATSAGLYSDRSQIAH